MKQDENYKYTIESAVLPKNSPLTATWNKYIQRMFDHGILLRYENVYIFNRGKCFDFLKKWNN